MSFPILPDDPGAPLLPSPHVSAGDVEDLRKDLERLMLITEALWRIARERWQCTDAELVQRIQDIDLEDGKLDGRKAASAPRECPYCQRTLAKHRPRCMYCGKAVAFLPFER